MVIEKIFEEVSGLLTEQQFEELYKHATSEPYNEYPRILGYPGIYRHILT